MRSIELLDLLLKHSSNVAGRFASLDLGSERVVKKVLLCSSLIFFQGIIENLLEFGGRCGCRVRLRHDGGSREGDSGLRGWGRRRPGPHLKHAVHACGDKRSDSNHSQNVTDSWEARGGANSTSDNGTQCRPLCNGGSGDTA